MNLGAFSKVFSSLPGNKPQTEIEKNRIADSCQCFSSEFVEVD